MNTIIWHNPRCSKSRQTLALLEDHGIEPEVRLYLEAPPSSEELTDVIAKLEIDPWALLRRGEAVFKELGLSKDSDSTRAMRLSAPYPPITLRDHTHPEQLAAQR